MKYIINAKDELNYTPLYKLCLKGYKGKLGPKIKHRPQGHKDRKEMLEILTQGGGKTVEENLSNKAEWLITAD